MPVARKTRASRKAAPGLKSLLRNLPSDTRFENRKIDGGEASLLGFSAKAVRKSKHPGLLLDGAGRWMGLNRRSVFWFMPHYGDSSFDPPEKGELALLLWRSAGSWNLALPFISPSARATFRGTEQGFTLELLQDVGTRPEASTPLVLVARGRDPFRLIRSSMALLAERLRSFRLLEEKTIPEFVDYLGWCTWNAFYKEVSGPKVLNGLRSFAKGGLMPGFVIIDDGWQEVKNERLQTFQANRKFAGGLAPVIEKAKRDYGVRLMGVWHAMEGYWQGTDASGPLSKEYGIRSVKDGSGFFAGWPASYDTESRDTVEPESIHRFYQDYHAELRRQGVDLVKIDNQGMLEFFCGEEIPRMKAYRAYQQALQGSSQTHFLGNLIHCMSNNTDILFNYSAGTVWRNSDDFYPKKDASAQGRHLIMNALNAFLTHTVSLPDWDMFQSDHWSGEYHAAARAISGGPIYLSDEPGRQNFELIRKLCYDDGSAVRPESAALPAADCLLTDCSREGKPLKIWNHSGPLGTLGLFHVGKRLENEEVAAPVRGTFSVSDVPVLEGQVFAVHHYQGDQLHLLERGEKPGVELAELGFDLLTLSPVDEGVAPIGLTDKMNPAATVAGGGWISDDRYETILYWGGTATFYCSTKPRSVFVNGEKARPRYAAKTGRLTVPAPTRGITTIELQF